MNHKMYNNNVITKVQYKLQSLLTAPSSMNQCSSPFVGRALPAGNGSFPTSSFKQPRTASALLAPVEITATHLALFKTGMEEGA